MRERGGFGIILSKKCSMSGANMNQDELFETISDNQTKFDRLLESICGKAEDIATEYEYPDGCLGVVKNQTKTEVNYPIQIRERRRTQPPVNAKRKKTGDGEDSSVITETKNGVRLEYVCTTIVTIALMKPRSEYSGCVELRVSVPLYNAVPLPKAEAVKERWIKQKNDDSPEAPGKQPERILSKYSVIVSLDSKELLPYLEDLMRYMLLHYRSTESAYGCCHLYEACSDAKKCISKDKMYATVCSYRKNLEAGRIFYGKNKNFPVSCNGGETERKQ